MKKSTLIKGLLAGAAIGVGALCPFAGAAVLAYLGVAAATTVGGAVGWGIAGAIGGGIGGSIVGLIPAAPGLVHFFRKAKKTVDNLEKEPAGFPAVDSLINDKTFANLNAKTGFAAASQPVAEKVTPAAAPEVKSALRFTR